MPNVNVSFESWCVSVKYVGYHAINGSYEYEVFRYGIKCGCIKTVNFVDWFFQSKEYCSVDRKFSFDDSRRTAHYAAIHILSFLDGELKGENVVQQNEKPKSEFDIEDYAEFQEIASAHELNEEKMARDNLRMNAKIIVDLKAELEEQKVLLGESKKREQILECARIQALELLKTSNGNLNYAIREKEDVDKSRSRMLSHLKDKYDELAALYKQKAEVDKELAKLNEQTLVARMFGYLWGKV